MGSAHVPEDAIKVDVDLSYEELTEFRQALELEQSSWPHRQRKALYVDGDMAIAQALLSEMPSSVYRVYFSDGYVDRVYA